MTGFPINPPRAKLVDQTGNVTSEWYRFFLAIQKLIGSGSTLPWEDSTLLAGGNEPPPTTDEILAGFSVGDDATLLAKVAVDDPTLADLGAAQVGSVEIDFGATPTDTANTTVTAASVTTSSAVNAWIVASDTTADNDAAAHGIAAASLRFLVQALSGQISIEAHPLIGLATGKFKVRYAFQ